MSAASIVRDLAAGVAFVDLDDSGPIELTVMRCPFCRRSGPYTEPENDSTITHLATCLVSRARAWRMSRRP